MVEEEEDLLSVHKNQKTKVKKNMPLPAINEANTNDDETKVDTPTDANDVDPTAAVDADSVDVLEKYNFVCPAHCCFPNACENLDKCTHLTAFSIHDIRRQVENNYRMTCMLLNSYTRIASIVQQGAMKDNPKLKRIKTYDDMAIFVCAKSLITLPTDQIKEEEQKS